MTRENRSIPKRKMKHDSDTHSEGEEAFESASEGEQEKEQERERLGHERISPSNVEPAPTEMIVQETVSPRRGLSKKASPPKEQSAQSSPQQAQPGTTNLWMTVSNQAKMQSELDRSIR